MSSYQRICSVSVIFLSLTLGISLGPAYGSGFAVVEQSVSGMGRSLAGVTVQAEDSSCIFFNPAAMTGLEGRQGLVAMHVIIPEFEFDNDGSNYPLLGGLPVRGGDGGNGGVTVFIPNIYYAQDISEGVKLGLGINAPFGLATEYDSSWVGRYHGIRTALRTLNINPCLAWKMSDAFSIGAGLSAQYIEAELTSAIDFGSMSAARGVPGAVPGMLDGRGKLKGDDWGYGFNLGVLCIPRPGSRIGLAYRSKVESTLKGDATFRVPGPAAALQAMNMFVDTDGEADLDTPETASLGISQRIGEFVELMADISWTGWSCFEELRVKYGSSQPDSVTEEDWEDTWRYAVGLNFFCSPRWTLRAGAAYDETPIPNEERRTPRIPDGDRIWFSLGAGYKATEDLSIDAGYTHLVFHDTKMNITGATGDHLTGDYDGSADIASLQASYSF